MFTLEIVVNSMNKVSAEWQCRADFGCTFNHQVTNAKTETGFHSVTTV